MENADNRIMGTEKIPSLMIRMAIPSVIAQVINILYNIVDRIYIGHISGVGAAALTGVGLTFPIITLISAFSAFVGSGGAPLASIYLIGTVFVEIALGLNPFIISQGRSTTAMMSIVIGAVINIVLDPIFIFVFHMGVKGAAIPRECSPL